VSTKEKLAHFAAQLDQLEREIEALAGPVENGGAADLSFFASHELGIAMSAIRSASRIILKQSAKL